MLVKLQRPPSRHKESFYLAYLHDPKHHHALTLDSPLVAAHIKPEAPEPIRHVNFIQTYLITYLWLLIGGLALLLAIELVFHV